MRINIIGGLPDLVAIHGMKRAGKGAIAAHLVAEHGYVPVKFAGALKEMVSALLSEVCGLDAATVERCIESDIKEVPLPRLGGKSARFAMQTLGTEWRNAVDRDLWVRIAVAEIQSLLAAGRRVVLDDLRFPGELEALRALEADLWFVRSSRTVSGCGPENYAPWEAAAAASLDVDDRVLRGMVGILLSRCGIPEREVERHLDGDLLDAPLDVLGGRSAAHCLRTLRSKWLPMLSAPANTASAAHPSEGGLPEAAFDVRLRNDGSLDDLRGRVDDALLGCRRAMAA